MTRVTPAGIRPASIAGLVCRTSADHLTILPHFAGGRRVTGQLGRGAQSIAVTPIPNCAVDGPLSVGERVDELPDAELAAAVDLARAAAARDGDDTVGDYVGVRAEGRHAATHLFEATLAAYRGWRWAVVVAHAGPDEPVTVNEVVLVPGPDALIAPPWVPWRQRVRAGDLGVGDLMPPPPGDYRLVPAYVESDDPDVEEVATDLGLGRVRVMSREGRLAAARRWEGGDFGPRAEMARSAPAHCGTCGFYLPMAGSLRAAFGVCGNELAPADGHVVHVEYGCGAHSEVEVEATAAVPIADLVYDDSVMEMEPVIPRPAPEPQVESAPVPEAAVAAPVAEAQAAPEAEAEAPAAEAEVQAGEAEVQPEPEPEATAEVAAEPKVQSEADAVRPEPEAESEPEAQPGPESDQT